MSSEMYRNQLASLHKEKANLESDLASERAKLARSQKEVSRLQEDIAKTKNESIRNSKMRQFSSKNDEIAKIQKKISDIEKKIAQKITAINSKIAQVTNAEKAETNRRQQQEREHLQIINDEIEQQISLENVRNTMSVIHMGRKIKVSKEAINAARQLLEMLNKGEIKKETRLFNWYSVNGSEITFDRDNGERADFIIPIADVKELAVYGGITLQEIRRKGYLNGWMMLLLPERLKEIISGRITSSTLPIFYSWQSWTPNNVNRNFIFEALEKAVKEIRNDDSLKIDPVIDRDTLGEAGSVDIADVIFRKIENCEIFVCDVTIITPPEAPNISPNPNVMLELGYAFAHLGWERIICILNTTYGDVDKLPFDLRGKRMLTYNLPIDAQNKSEVRKKLVESIKGAILVILEQVTKNSILVLEESEADKLSEDI